MICPFCAGDQPVDSENFWLQEETRNGFTGQRLYYGIRAVGITAQRAVLSAPDIMLAMQETIIHRMQEDIHVPIKLREVIAIYNYPTGETAYPILDGIIVARFEHQRSGVVIEFHLCVDNDWRLLANVRRISNDTHAFTHLKQARKFLKIQSKTKRAVLTLDNLVSAAWECNKNGIKITDQSLAHAIYDLTGKKVDTGAVKMFRKREGRGSPIPLDYFRRFGPKSLKPINKRGNKKIAQ